MAQNPQVGTQRSVSTHLRDLALEEVVPTE